MEELGRSRGVDSDHAFVPEETIGGTALRLRQVAIGDQHMLAEGASVWMKLTTHTNDPVHALGHGKDETGIFVEPLAGPSSSLGAIASDFVANSTSWVCCFVGLDADDVDKDEDNGK